VTLLGHAGPALAWKQEADALVITCPDTTSFRTALAFRIE
jgi:alpha-L-fucosidase